MKTTYSAKQSGFTLVEMALVLVIIGLILGAVSIGKDMQRTSEYKKVKQKFIDQWEQAYNQHYMRTGVVVGDSQEAPTLAVNAAANTTIRDAFFNVSNGDYTSLTPPHRLCHGLNNDGYQGKRADADNNLHKYFDQAGVEMPPGRSEGREDRYVYLDSNGNPQEIQVCFQWNNPSTSSGSGNVMVIAGLTPDLARMLDEMIDGQANASEGRFREQRSDNTNVNTAWTYTNMDNIGATVAGTTPQDEDQVKVLTAHYKMNQ